MTDLSSNSSFGTSPRPARSGGSGGSGVSIVVALAALVMFAPVVIAVTGFTLGAAGPVVIGMLSVLGIYALFEALDN